MGRLTGGQARNELRGFWAWWVRRPILNVGRWFTQRDELFRDFTNAVIALASVYIAFQANGIARNQSTLMETQNLLLVREQEPLFDLDLEPDGDVQTLVVTNVRGTATNVQADAAVTIPVCLSEDTDATSDPLDHRLDFDPDSCHVLVIEDVFVPFTIVRDGPAEWRASHASIATSALADRLEAITQDLEGVPVGDGRHLVLLEPTIEVDVSFTDADGTYHDLTMTTPFNGRGTTTSDADVLAPNDAMAGVTTGDDAVGVTTDAEGNPRYYERFRIGQEALTTATILDWWEGDEATPDASPAA